MEKNITSVTPHAASRSASSKAVLASPTSLVENNVNSHYQRHNSSSVYNTTERDALLEVN